MSFEHPNGPFIGTYDEFPLHYRHNQYITRGYRVGFRGWKSMARTLCMCHNETVNVWSHGIGALIFITILVYMASYYPDMYQSDAVAPLH